MRDSEELIDEEALSLAKLWSTDEYQVEDDQDDNVSTALPDTSPSTPT